MPGLGPNSIGEKILTKILMKILSKSYNKKFNIFKLEFRQDFFPIELGPCLFNGVINVLSCVKINYEVK